MAEPVFVAVETRPDRRPALGYLMVMTAATLWAVNGAVSKLWAVRGSTFAVTVRALPRRMRRAAAPACVILLFAVIAAPGGARPGSGTQALPLTPRESALVAAINSARTARMLSKLRVDDALTRAARYHSRDMLRRQYFAHGDFRRRMGTFHVRGHLFAENLVWASGVLSAKSAVAAWLKSPPHRANLLDPRLHRVGVATPIGRYGGYSRSTMVTADFAG